MKKLFLSGFFEKKKREIALIEILKHLLLGEVTYYPLIVPCFFIYGGNHEII